MRKNISSFLLKQFTFIPAIAAAQYRYFVMDRQALIKPKAQRGLTRARPGKITYANHLALRRKNRKDIFTVEKIPKKNY
jgi:hypothetical protein